MTLMNRVFPILTIVAVGMFAYAPILILGAPYESTMGLVQKIFYFHVPSWMVMFTSAFVCGLASLVYLFTSRPSADRLAVAAAELTVLFGLIGLITGPLWGRKAWGVWWQWDARLTSALVLWLIFAAYLLLRRYGGAGSEKLSAVVAMFGMANVPFVYWSVNVWRTVHPKTTVVMTLQPGMRGPFWWCVAAFVLLFVLLLTSRVRIESRRAELEGLFLALED
jgi:heme exporter protein C